MSRLPRRARGGIGRRARFRSVFRKEWWFDSTRAHHSHSGWNPACLALSLQPPPLEVWDGASEHSPLEVKPLTAIAVGAGVLVLTPVVWPAVSGTLGIVRLLAKQLLKNGLSVVASHPVKAIKGDLTVPGMASHAAKEVSDMVNAE